MKKLHCIFLVITLSFGCDKNPDEPYPRKGLRYSVMVTRLTNCLPDRTYVIIVYDQVLGTKIDSAGRTYVHFPKLTNICGPRRQDSANGKTDFIDGYDLELWIEKDYNPKPDSLVVEVLVTLYTHTVRYSEPMVITLYRGTPVVLKGEWQ